jgi:hypothetical protein
MGPGQRGAHGCRRVDRALYLGLWLYHRTGLGYRAIVPDRSEISQC